MKSQNARPFMLMRHGQSVHNLRVIQLANQKGSQIKQTPQYKEIKFDSVLMDGSITPQGKNQALKAKQTMNFQQIGLVLVSPLRRALETSQQVFANQNHINHIKFYVQPLLIEFISSAVDIPSKISESRQIFQKRYNFQKIPKGKQQEWFIDFITNEQIRQKIIKLGKETNKSIFEATLQVMKTSLIQNYFQLQARVCKLKQILNQYAKMTDKKILLIGHSALFQTLTATQFDHQGKPVNGLCIKNCQVKQINTNAIYQQI